MMVVLLLLLPIFIALLLNLRNKSNKEWDLAVKEYRRENCDIHKWYYHPVSNKLECISCGFTP